MDEFKDSWDQYKKKKRVRIDFLNERNIKVLLDMKYKTIQAISKKTPIDSSEKKHTRRIIKDDDDVIVVEFKEKTKAPDEDIPEEERAYRKLAEEAQANLW